MHGSATKGILEKQSLGMTGTLESKGSDFGRRETPTRPFHEFDQAKTTPMPWPRTSVDVRCMHVSHSLAISCKALNVCRTPS